MSRSRYPAIDALKEYIDMRYDSANAFARENGLDASEVYKILRGERGDRMTVKMAAAIEDATGSHVRIRMWLPKKGR